MDIDDEAYAQALRAAAAEQGLLLFEFTDPGCCNMQYSEPYEGQFVLIPLTEENVDTADCGAVPWDAREAADDGKAGDLAAMTRQLFEGWDSDEITEHLNLYHKP